MTHKLQLSFGQWLKQRRKALDLTQEDLADRIGCSDVTIRKIESGVRRPSRQIAELLVDFLKIPAEERQAFVNFARTGTTGTLQAVEAGSGATSLRAPNNLPSHTTNLVGREQEIDVLLDLMAQDRMRLLTLTGPPGIGKTSLSTHLATELIPDFPGGVFFVPLAPVTDPGLVVTTIAQTLGIMEAGDQSTLAGLESFLQDKRVLLVLDNFEQVLEAAIIVAQLLANCPLLKVVVTSRAALNLRGERQFPVQPLAIPGKEERPSVGSITAYPAVALFVERAKAVDPDFALTDLNAGAIADICARLDGLPLAIELAAARINLLSAQEIAIRLDNRLALLKGGPRDLPPRHRMLRDAMAWSYDLLDAGDQTLFRRLGVFAGGFTLSPVEAICNAAGDLPIDALDGLSSLLDKSLLQRRREHQAGLDSRPRFSMLETIREYALEHLAAGGEEGATRRAHAEYYLALAEAGDVQLRGPEQDEWVERLETEHDNFRAAINWSLTQNEVEIGLRLAGELGWFWELRGHYTEGRARLADMLTAYPSRSSPQGRTAVAARALNSAGRLAYVQGDIVQSRVLLDQAFDIANELDDKWLMLLTLHNLGNVAAAQGDEHLARTFYEQSLEAARQCGEAWGLAWALMGMGYICINSDDYEGARVYFEESLEVRRKMRDKWGIARSLTELGAVARLQGDYSKARPLYEQAEAIHEELGQKLWVSNAKYSLGHVALHLGEYAQAEKQFLEALSFYKELGDMVSSATCLAGFGLAAYREGNSERAATLFAATGAAHSVSGYHMEAFDRVEFEAAIETVRKTAESDPAIAEAWAQGEKITLEEAITYALKDVSTTQSTSKE